MIVAWYAHVILFHPISPLYSNDTTEYMMPTMDSSCPLSHNIGIYWDIHIIHLLCHYIPFYLHDILIISSSYSVIFHCTSHCIPMIFKFWWNCKWHIRMRFQSYWMFISPSMWYIPMTYGIFQWHSHGTLSHWYPNDIPSNNPILFQWYSQAIFASQATAFRQRDILVFYSGSGIQSASHPKGAGDGAMNSM